MKYNNSLVQQNVAFLSRIGIMILLMSLTRLIFYFNNFGTFNHVTPLDFLGGIWLDIITVCIYCLPFTAFSMIPFNFYFQRGYQLVLKILFHITNIALLIPNLIDVEYFKYTAKRSTADLFSMIEVGNDMTNLLPTFLLDFWWIILLFILLIIFSNWLYNKTLPLKIVKMNFFYHFLNLFVMAVVVVLLGRGGIGYRPADMLLAYKLTSSSKVALVANTPLSIIKTIGKSTIEERNFFPKGSPMILQPIHTGSDDFKMMDSPNIVVLILESFGDEWLGKKQGTPYTPFLDSLLDESLYFDNAFANGRKSIESVPSIFASLPSLMDNPYLTSPYETNTIDGLPKILKKVGYSSAFYHGATNGSMKFDVFSASLGFEKYVGKNEYGNEAHSDNTWGILDEYFLPWTANEITSDLTEPFLAGLFTLSSHHPFYVPEKYRNTLPKGEFPMAQSIAYADMSLRLFFEEAKKQPWYKNTVFVITADHTPAGTTPLFTQKPLIYNIPIAFFDPSGTILPQKVHSIFSQIDILPTLLDLIGYKKDSYCYGTSYFRNKHPYAINYLQNTFVLFKEDKMMEFIEDKADGIYNYKEDLYLQFDSLNYFPSLHIEMENIIKGIIQRYNHDLIYNKMTLN